MVSSPTPTELSTAPAMNNPAHRSFPSTPPFAKAATVSLILCLSSIAVIAQTPPLPPAAEKVKDVVVDTPTAAPPPTPAPTSLPSPAVGGRIVPVQVERIQPGAQAVPSSNITTTANAAVPAVAASALHQARINQLAAGLGDVGMGLLRDQGSKGAANRVVSPFSIANALGMAHAGAEGHTRDQISGLFEPRSAAGRVFTMGMQQINRALHGTNAGVEFVSANRLWVGQSLAPQLAPSFVSILKDTYASDGKLVDFAKDETARAEINDWVSAATKSRIKDLIPTGVIKPTTKAIITNAIYFNGLWKTSFDAAATQPRPFKADGGRVFDVPTMNGEIAFREGTVDGLTVYELPYQGDQFSLMIAMAAPGHALQALIDDTAGADVAGWSDRLTAVAKAPFSLPKFKIEATPTSLKDNLQRMGMVAAFGADAKFTGVTGKANDLQIDQVLHAAGIIVDERGTEATAATAVAMTSKSLSLPPKPRVVDRPFLFAVIHKATRTPLFVGSIANPAL